MSDPLPPAGFGPRPRDQGLSLPAKLAIGCVAVGGLGTMALVMLLLALGLGIELGQVPDTAALPAGKIPPRIVENLREMGVVAPDEAVLYFYSAGFLSVEEDGNLFTDRRVISYQQEEGGELELHSATWDEVEDLEFSNSDSWLEDSAITVYTTDGDWFLLLVGAESQRDDDFFKKLERQWRTKRTDPALPEATETSP